MTKYILTATYRDSSSMSTMLTNTETDFCYEEIWTKTADSWEWENGWSTDGGDQDSLWQTLGENTELTDSMLTELFNSYHGEIEFEA